MKPILLLTFLILTLNLVAQSPGGVGTTNITSWFLADNLPTGDVTSWTTEYPTGINAITLTDPITTAYSQATSAPPNDVSNYNMTLDFSANASNMSLDNTGTFNLLDNVTTGNTGTLFLSFLSLQADPNGHMFLYNENSGIGDAIQLRTLGTTNSTIRLALGKQPSNSTNACRDKAYDFSPTIVGYKGNRNNNLSMTAFNDDLIYTTSPASQSSGSRGIYIGKHSNANNSYYNGFINEIITYNTDLSNLEITKVNTYLGIKFGITLDNTGGGAQGDYIATNDQIVWDASLMGGYHYDVIGICRDDNEALIQKQSHSFDDITRLYIDNLAVTNGTNLGAFPNDLTYLVSGHNNDIMCSTAASNIEIPSGYDITNRLAREWKVTKTDFIQNFNMDFTTNICPDFISANLTNLKLLIDDDGDFLNADVYTQANGITFQIIGNIISVIGINGTQIPNNSTKYLTLAIGGITSNFAMPDSTICVGETITFSDSSFTAPITWDWEFPGGDITSANTQGSHTITFNTPGSYDIKLTVTDATSFDDSTITITVSGYPTLDAGLNDTICAGEDYTFLAVILEPNATSPVWGNGVPDGDPFTPLDSMMYFVTSNINGCESVDSVIIELVEVPDISVPPVITLCEGEDTLLNATSSNANAIITWDLGVMNNQLFTPLDSALYTAISSITIGTIVCSSTNQTQINVNIIPAVDAGLNDTICEGDDFTLTAINPDGATLTWNNGETNGVTFTPVTSLEYIVISTLNGCVNTDTMSLEVNPNPELTLTPAITICDGDNALLNATSIDADAISWDNGITNNLLFTPINTTTYTATAIITIGTNVCTTLENVTVTVNPNPTVDAYTGPIPITLCKGESYILTAYNPDGGNLTWTNGIMNGTPFTPMDSLIYHVSSELNGCISTDSIIVNVLESPVAYAGPDQYICIGDSAMLSGTTQNQIVSAYSWDQGIGTLNNIYVHPINTQVYTVTASLGNCLSIDDVTIIVVELPDPAFSFNPNPVSIENTEVQFTQFNVYEGEVYDWDFDDNTSSGLESPIHIFPELPGISYDVTLTITDSIGCTDWSTMEIKIHDVLIYYIPNAFTPDGDTYNEMFQPVFTSGYDLYDYHLIIFNRWGETLFESFNDQQGWDGTYNGEKVADGVYVWTVQFGELLTDKKIIDKGTVTIVR